MYFFFFSSRRRHTRFDCDWSSDVCSSDLHCNDANLNGRSLLASFGGQESDASGQNVLIDSKETREALRFAKALFDEGMTPEVFSWDDASDNRYLASGVASWIHDAISAYRTTEDTNPKVFQNTYIALEPQGAGGKRVSVANPNVYLIWKFAKNPQAAKEFLEYLSDNWKDGMIASRGYNMPFLKDGYKKPMPVIDRKSTRLNSSHSQISYAVFCLKKTTTT